MAALLGWLCFGRQGSGKGMRARDQQRFPGMGQNSTFATGAAENCVGIWEAGAFASCYGVNLAGCCGGRVLRGAGCYDGMMRGGGCCLGAGAAEGAGVALGGRACGRAGLVGQALRRFSFMAFHAGCRVNLAAAAGGRCCGGGSVFVSILTHRHRPTSRIGSLAACGDAKQ